ncbi:MAG: resolvase [Pseudolabrys sp.]|nr:resolvase [Pseudolabrys sp.]
MPPLATGDTGTGRFGAALPDALVRRAQDAVARLLTMQPAPRRERLSGIHNPWGFAAGLTDPWSFLDVCESDFVVDAIERVIGSDIVLWDSELYLRARDYRAFVADGREGRYWPTEPLAGAMALLTLGASPALHVSDVRERAALPADIADDEPLYVIRTMPAASRFSRNATMPANRAAMQEQLLINYTTRPLWLLRGEDRAGNDFVTGFASDPPRWASR